ncbi:unnamed protein product [Brassica rapa subsp. narinosa]
MVKRLRLNDLPDELILKIFSMLPNFKESVATHLISEQHENPYNLVSDVTLEYDNEESFVTFMSFYYGSLFVRDGGRILERLHLKLNRNYSASDINFWVQVAVNSSVRKLRINLYGGTLVLPSCLSTCTTLKSLILREVTINHVPRGFCLPSLKSLHLFSVEFSQKASNARLLQNYYGINDEVRFCLPSLRSLHLLSAVHCTSGLLTHLLQSCPVLEYLVVSQTERELSPVFSVIPPESRLSSIKSLHLLSVELSNDKAIATLLKRCAGSLEYLVLNRTCYYYSERVSLSSLKSLHLLSPSSNNIACNSLTRLLQSCPVLEYLVVSQTERDYMPMFRVIPPESCLSSIKSLHLSSVKFHGDEYVATLLKRCAALEHLVISRTRYDNVKLYDINVPTLKSLTINNSREKRTDDDEKENHGFLINAPALQTLNIKDTVSNFLMLEFTPEVTKANIQVTCDQSDKFIGYLTSVQHLSLCSPTFETPYRRGSVFSYLEHLELCTCSAGWVNLLASILNESPRLQSLKLMSNHSAQYNDPMSFWDEPVVVPECLLTHLEIFEWRQYENTVQHRKVAACILANATCLKMATFSTRSRNKDHRMVMKLKKLKRISKTCQLVFE